MKLKIRFSLLFSLFLVAIGSTIAQVSDSLFDSYSKSEDILILNEELDVNITGEKVAFMLANVTKKQTIVINNTAGISYFQPITLPERFDKLHINHSPSVRNLNWSFDNITINYFNAKNHTNSSELIVSKNVDKLRTLDIEGYFGTVNKYAYNIEGIDVGDTIVLEYSYIIPFIDNWIKLLSNRIFFHGKYPKKSFSINWCYDIHLVVDSAWINLDAPEVKVNNHKICYQWELSNLPGSLDEPGSRPYKDLPHFYFLPKSYDLEYTHFNSFKMEFIPPYFFAANDVQNKLYTEYWDNVIGTKDKNNSAYRKITDRYKRLLPDDTIGLTRMRYIQRYIVDSVRYDPAIEYYKRNENHLKERAGVELYAGSIKDNNLERVYGNIVHKLGLDLFTAYPVDSRVGEISRYYNNTVKDNDLLFGVVMNNKTLGFVIPRSDRNFYYFEELPFYYENIPVLLLHVLDYSNALDKRNFNTEFREIFTPVSNWKENYRKIQGAANVDLNYNTIDFQTRIILSGQYSTLTRNIYKSNPVDSTINPKYFDPIWNISEDVELKDITVKQGNFYYPFVTSIIGKYHSDNTIESKDSIHIIRPGSWFKLVFWDGISKNERFLDYYPDFVGSDQYSYMLNFNKPIELIDDSACDINIKNDYASLVFKIKQTSPESILINLNYDIITRKVSKDDIIQVVEINSLINEIFDYELKLKAIQQ